MLSLKPATRVPWRSTRTPRVLGPRASPRAERGPEAGAAAAAAGAAGPAAGPGPPLGQSAGSSTAECGRDGAGRWRLSITPAPTGRPDAAGETGESVARTWFRLVLVIYRAAISLLTQGVPPGVPQDPLAPHRGPLGPSPDRESAVGNAANAPALAPGPLAAL